MEARPALPPPAAPRSAASAVQQPTGMYLSDWAGPPVSANYLAFGYTAVQGGRLVLMGYFYNVTQPDAANARCSERSTTDRWMKPARGRSPATSRPTS